MEELFVVIKIPEFELCSFLEMFKTREASAKLESRHSYIDVMETGFMRVLGDEENRRKSHWPI